MLYYSREKLDSREKQDMDDIDNEESTPYFPSFRIWLCGTFRVERRLGNGYEPIRTTEWGGSSYPRLLLKALLCCPGRQARRDALLDMLWPDAELEQAVQNLNTAVTRLRRVLAPSKGEASLLLTDEDSRVYRLAEQSLLWVDVDVALTRLSEAERRGRTSPEALSQLEEAESYLSKGMILQDEEGQWAAGRRATVEQARYRCRLWLAEAYVQQQMPGQAETILNLLLEEDPIDEDVLARLMLLLHRQGMTHQALRRYHAFIEIAAREELEPTEDVRLLAERLRSEKQRSVSDPKHHSIDWGESIEHPSQEMYAIATEIVQPFKEAESQMLRSSRRQLMQQVLSATGMVMVAPSSLLEQFAQVLARPSTIDEATFRYLETRTAHYWRDRHSAMVASSLLLGYVLEHLQKILTFLEGSFLPSERRRLCALASGTAQLIGHLFFDLSDHRHARKFHEKAIQAAQEANNTALEAAAWGRMSFTWSYSGNVQKALPYIQQARSLAAGKTAQVVQDYLSAIEAEVQAMLHDREASLKALGEAEWINKQPENGEDQYWLRFDRSRLAGYQGTCFQRFYRPEDPQTSAFLLQAQKNLKEALALLSPSMIQRRPALLIDLARTFTQQSEIEEACDHAIQAIIILAQLQSRTGIRRLLTLRRDMNPWLDTSYVKNVDEHLEALLPEWQRSV